MTINRLLAVSLFERINQYNSFHWPLPACICTLKQQGAKVSI